MILLIDIEKELRSIKTEYKPDEGLRRRTRSLAASAVREKRKTRTASRKVAFVYSPIVAFALILAICISMLTAAPAKAAGYYTVDINPSISLAVDSNNTVISVSAENEDAEALLKGMSITGMRFEDALKTIVQAASENDYLKENGHVLVAYFGAGEGMTQDEIASIVGGQLHGEKVTTLALHGSIDDYNNAKKSGKKAGIELLMNSAGAAGTDKSDTDDAIIILKDKLKNETGKPEDKGNNGNGNNNGPGNGRDNGNNGNGNNNGQGNGRGNGNNGNGNNNGPGAANTDNGNNGNNKDKDKDKDKGFNKDKDSAANEVNTAGNKNN